MFFERWRAYVILGFCSNWEKMLVVSFEKSIVKGVIAIFGYQVIN